MIGYIICTLKCASHHNRSKWKNWENLNFIQQQESLKIFLGKTFFRRNAPSIKSKRSLSDPAFFAYSITETATTDTAESLLCSSEQHFVFSIALKFSKLMQLLQTASFLSYHQSSVGPQGPPAIWLKGRTIQALNVGLKTSLSWLLTLLCTWSKSSCAICPGHMCPGCIT